MRVWTFSSDEFYKRIDAKCCLPIMGCKMSTNSSGSTLLWALPALSSVLHPPCRLTLHEPKLRVSPFASQVAVRRRTSAWTKTCTHWRRPRRVPAMSFCRSPLGTGPIASSQARQLPALWKVGPDIGRGRSAAKVCATKLLPALTSRDAWWIPPCVRKPVSRFLWLLRTGIVVSFVSKWKMLPQRKKDTPPRQTICINSVYQMVFLVLLVELVYNLSWGQMCKAEDKLTHSEIV